MLHVMLASVVKYSTPVTHTQSLFLRLFSHIGHCRAQSTVPSAIQRVHISYLFCIE